MTEVVLVCLPLLKSAFLKNFGRLFHVPCTSRLELFLSKRLKRETVAIYHFVIRPSRNQLCRGAPLFGPFSGPLVWVGGDLEDSVLEEGVVCHCAVCLQPAQTTRNAHFRTTAFRTGTAVNGKVQ